MTLPWLARDPASPFPPVASAKRSPNGLLAVGGDLAPERLLNAYRNGIFPWYSEGTPILWWTPDPRCVFRTESMHMPRRLRRFLRGCDWRIESDRRFLGVIEGCAGDRPDVGGGEPGTWIVPEMKAAYVRMHELGHAHSIEVIAGDQLVGGLYGLVIGRMFFAESMFSAEDHGSKVALLALAHSMSAWGWPLIDAQVASPHLFTLGASTVPRADFLRALQPLLDPAQAMPWASAWQDMEARNLARAS